MLNDDDFPVLSSSPAGPSNQRITQQKNPSIDGSRLSWIKQEHRPLTTEITDDKNGIQTHPDGRVTNIPAGMLSDQFGMAGLLTFLRTIESAPSIVGLALGHDLTNLGLNLNSSKRNLFQTFGGPWADFPCRIQDLDAKVPEEYLTNATIRDKLPNIKLNKLDEDVLFYLFYNCPGEVYQVAAASELYVRDWRFHKTDRVWLKQCAFAAPFGRQSSSSRTPKPSERTNYVVFDPIQWRRVPKEMVLDYKELEGKPSVPGTAAPPPLVPPTNMTRTVHPNAAPQQNLANQTRQTPQHQPSGTTGSGGASQPHTKKDDGRKPMGPPNDELVLTGLILRKLQRIVQGQSVHRIDVPVIVNYLTKNPGLLAHQDLRDQFLTFLQAEPEIAGILLTFQLMFELKTYQQNLDILLNMEPNVQVLMAVNKFVQMCEIRSLPVPMDFMNKFISLCIATCERDDSQQDVAVHRLARMVCVFLTTLLGIANFDSSARRAEIQNFAMLYLSLREGSTLYQKTLSHVSK